MQAGDTVEIIKFRDKETEDRYARLGVRIGTELEVLRTEPRRCEATCSFFDNCYRPNMLILAGNKFARISACQAELRKVEL